MSNYPKFNSTVTYSIGSIVVSGFKLYIATENGPFSAGRNNWDYYLGPIKTKLGNQLNCSNI